MRNKFNEFWSVTYTDGSERDQERNKEQEPQLFEELRLAGFYVSRAGDKVTIQCDPKKLKTHKAGRRRRTSYNDSTTDFYRYSDIIFMMQTMKDKEIYEKIGMSHTAFYNHRKAMQETKYYKTLDKNRLNDLEYLKSHMDSTNGKFNIFDQVF